ncbi:hypothetical protein PanWU01x14_163290, partial [Parasponia andersonii]
CHKNYQAIPQKRNEENQKLANSLNLRRKLPSFKSPTKITNGATTLRIKIRRCKGEFGNSTHNFKIKFVKCTVTHSYTRHKLLHVLISRQMMKFYIHCAYHNPKKETT